MTRTTSTGRAYRIKVVPDSNPNADGIWISCGTHHKIPRRSFTRQVSRLARFCPAGHHVVQIESSATPEASQL